MIIQQVEFIKSAVNPPHYPDSTLPEIAFAGRSNVGKSSLINCLVRRKNLVKTSSKPGCTQLINFFRVNDALTFVDLPGYGYAKVSKKIRSQWQPMVNTYLSSRDNLLGLILLIDIRREPEKEELDLARWLEDHGLPYLVILTKGDKLGRTQQDKRSQMISQSIGRRRDEVIPFSSKTGMGRDRILNEIGYLLEWHKEQKTINE